MLKKIFAIFSNELEKSFCLKDEYKLKIKVQWILKDTASTLQGEEITVSVTEEAEFINDAEVTSADRIGTNGVFHVIDAVILPPSFTE